MTVRPCADCCVAGWPHANPDCPECEGRPPLCGPIVIVAGSRSIPADACMGPLDAMLRDLSAPCIGWPSEVYSGGARGPDRAGARWAEINGVARSVFRPDWHRFGKRAGIMRNEMMATVAASTAARTRREAHLVAFHDGTSRGTADMIERARAHGLRVTVIR